MSVYLNDLAVTCALGSGKAAVSRALFALEAGGVAPSTLYSAGPLALGRITDPLPSSEAWPLKFRSRNNRVFAQVLAQLRPAIDAAIAHYGVHRVACMVGTSTSGIAEGEQAVAHLAKTQALPDWFSYAHQEIGNAADFASLVLGLGISTVISTACSSSAKALASAARLLEAGLADVVVAGGVDTLCGFTVAGFSALESVSSGRCNPLSKNRHGINIGEAGAFFIVSRTPGPVRLAGWGETSDAHHMSAPEPSGRGAKAAIDAALARAQVKGDQVSYVNLHGTATVQNDAMESKAVAAAIGLEVPVSSTKPLTGHTLGAAGALEAALCWLSMTDPAGRLPPHHWDGERDPELPALQVVNPGTALGAPPKVVVSNSFAFGGNNAALVLVRE